MLRWYFYNITATVIKGHLIFRMTLTFETRDCKSLEEATQLYPLRLQRYFCIDVVELKRPYNKLSYESIVPRGVLKDSLSPQHQCKNIAEVATGRAELPPSDEHKKRRRKTAHPSSGFWLLLAGIHFLLSALHADCGYTMYIPTVLHYCLLLTTSSTPIPYNYLIR